MIEILSAIAVAGGLLVGRWVADRHRKKALREGPAAEWKREGAEGASDSRASDEAPPLRPRKLAREAALAEDARTVDFSAFPCALGDVVMRTLDGAEAWLAGAIVLREDAPAAVLFFAPDASGERAIYVRALPRAELSWLTPVRRDALLVGPEPPSAIEIDGLRFDRHRRLPFHVERVGAGAPDVGETAIVGEYRAASGEVAIVLVADGVGRGWLGRRLGEGEYEVWSGEKTGA